MMIRIKGYEVYLGADLGTKEYTINIPELKIFKSLTISKNEITVMETTAKELIEEKLNQ
ncbi:hypothetical protein [Epilithonimonas sp. UC225_85]|uniref:hypothetical protein n=1 Tax=Epilithonimonas sp. UC225_85 TaxID=3350167 RepID=UPI0036D31439